MQITSFLESLRSLAAEDPDRELFLFADGKGRIVDSVSRSALLSRVDTMSGYLRGSVGLEPGERALMVYTPSIDFIIAFAACMSAGIIPVPVYPPNPLNLAHDLPAFSRMAADCGARIALTNRLYNRAAMVGKLGSMLRLKRVQWPAEVRWIETDRIGESGWPATPGPPVSAESIALIQYTSGSTSAPKGVMITHGNIAHQIAFNAALHHLTPDSRSVLWVPQFHDFGLITGILNILSGNGMMVLVSPLDFIQRPAIWLELMSDHRATHTAAPNFAYELVVRKTTPEQRSQWDLSTLRHAIIAAEPIRAATLDAFSEAFAVSGFDRAMFAPAYGLAEHTVGVTVRGTTIVHHDRTSLEQRGVLVTAEGDRQVGCGKPPIDVVVRIVDPDSHELVADGRVGEVWVDSPSKAAGYWGNQEATEATFEVRLAEPDGRTYLRTGDLGLIDPVSGELLIYGRHKDLVIVAGRNIQPQDVELSVEEAHPSIRPGCVACFSVDRIDAEPQLIIAAELRDAHTAEADAIADAVRLQVSRNHRVRCDELLLLAPRTIAKTTSGKIQRARTKERWRDRDLVVVHRSTGQGGRDLVIPDVDVPPGPSAELVEGAEQLRQQLVQAIAETLGVDVDALPTDRALTEYGLSSLSAVEALRRFQELTGIDVSLSELATHASIDALAEHLVREGAQPQRSDDYDEILL